MKKALYTIFAAGLTVSILGVVLLSVLSMIKGDRIEQLAEQQKEQIIIKQRATLEANKQLEAVKQAESEINKIEASFLLPAK